ncbi:hypothetical protein POL67_42005 [Polyangium sp. rjm3]|uniref:Uncharacterized protein n=1 Tax=Polyangium mundeleinium TaxID=2995306 RepID=A0ABT5F1M5_9BACT|nr:hypothetical protein [Polyangium mundeleinium]MDC0747979.1 hypothetical protein [Polyangium mundeleinium]
MLSRRAILSSGLVFAGSLLVSRRAFAKKPEKDPIPALPLSFAVAEEDGVAVQNETWIAEQITEATRLFTPIGVTLRKASARVLPPALARLETRADRDALAAHLEAKRINVMIVASLRDVDDPKLFDGRALAAQKDAGEALGDRRGERTTEHARARARPFLRARPQRRDRQRDELFAYGCSPFLRRQAG